VLRQAFCVPAIQNGAAPNGLARPGARRELGGVSRMKAVFIIPGESGGRASVLDRSVPDPGPDQVLVRVRASALNRGELAVMERARSGEAIPVGIEYSGVVVTRGKNVRDLAEGARVMGHGAADAALHNAGHGRLAQSRQSAGMAEYVLASPGALMPMPAGMDFTEAAAFPNAFVTSHDALVTNGGLAAGDVVLVNAATSGIGTAAIQIARLLGAGKIIGVARRRERLEALSSLGLTHSIATDDTPLVQGVKDLTEGRGVDLLIDSLGGAVFSDNLQSMALAGRIVSVGRITGHQASIDLDYLSLRRLRLIGVTFRTRTPEQSLSCVARCREDLLPALNAGRIKPVVGRTFSIDEITEAYACLRSGDHIGKIVVTIGR
jgi:NADPH:quinone reductase